jgi:hypothetical protein
MIAAAVGGTALALVAALYVWPRPAAKSVLDVSAPAPEEERPAPGPATTGCLPSGDGFLRARLDGALQLRLDWANEGLQCEGMPRPEGKGIRMSFSRALDDEGKRLVIVFGIAGLSESSSGRALPANLTIVEEGGKQIFGTLGDDKCVVDDVSQQLITPWRRESRTYRVSGRGFCMQPARAVGGEAGVLMSSFDFAGQVRYEDAPQTAPEKAP